MTTPVSRRAALAAGVTATAGLLGASAAPVPKGDDKSWVGKTVLPKKPDPVGHNPPPPDAPLPPNENGTPAEYAHPLYGASWEVKAEKGSRVQVIEVGVACWAEKELLVTLADATDFYTKAIAADATDAYAHNFRGWAKYLLGKRDDAVKDFDAFLALTPVAATGHRVVGLSNRGLVLAELGKFDAALVDLDEAAKTNHCPAILNRGWAHELQGAYAQAAADYAALLALRPADELGLNNAAWLKATCPDAAFRDGREAVRLAKAACERTANRDGGHLDTLAAAHAEAGDFAAAVAAQEQALEDRGFAKKHGDDAQKRLQLYKDKKPFRTTPLKAK